MPYRVPSAGGAYQARAEAERKPNALVLQLIEPRCAASMAPRQLAAGYLTFPQAQKVNLSAK